MNNEGSQHVVLCGICDFISLVAMRFLITVPVAVFSKRKREETHPVAVLRACLLPFG